MRNKLLPAVLAILLAAPAGQAAAQAASAPYKLGRAEVVALSDGILHNDFAPLVAESSRPHLLQLMGSGGRGTQRDTSVNAYLIRAHGKLVLIDTGAGSAFGPTLGKVSQSLALAGVQPGDIADIFITHLHPDHFGGLVKPDGSPAYPNATVHLARAEADYWLSPAVAAKAPAPQKDWFEGAQKALKPYKDAGRLKPFDGTATFFPGFRARPSAGHTPGHTVYVLTDGGKAVAFWGDLVNADFQFADPRLPLVYDSDAPKATAERLRSLADAATRGEVIALAHQDFPGLGRVKSASPAYRWEPVAGLSDAPAK